MLDHNSEIEQIPKILLVDDEIDIIELIKYHLEKEGYLVRTAINGIECLKIARSFLPDLILLDVMMPEMDGYEATELIRGGELGNVTGNIPIIAVTADAMQETRQRVLDLGMNDYMTKPVKRGLLLQKIKNCSEESNKLNIVA